MTPLVWKFGRGEWTSKKDRESETKVSPLKLFYIKVRQQEKTLRLWLVYHWQKQQAFFFPGQCLVQETKANHKPTRRPVFCLLMHAHWSGETNFSGFGALACTQTCKQTFPSKNIRTHTEVTNKAQSSGFLLNLSPLLRRPTHILSGDTTSCLTEK